MRWKSVVIILVFIASLLPFSPARAADDALLEMNVTITLIDGSGEWAGDITCVSDTGDTETGLQFAIQGYDIVCSGSPTFQTTENFGNYGPARFRVQMSVRKAENLVGDQAYWIDSYIATTNTAWTIWEQSIGPSNGMVGYSTSPAPGALMSFSAVSSSSPSLAQPVTIYFHAAVHEFNTTETIGDCDDHYQPVLVITTATILANSETGLEFNNLENGHTYELKIEGGPWNDGQGNSNRYDTAIMEGESSWVTTDSYGDGTNINCDQVDVEHPFTTKLVFTAIDVSFAVRVNDLTGQFADNTYGTSVMQATITEVQETNYGDCTNQYLPGQLLGTASLPAKSSTGINLYTVLGSKYPQAGDWMIIKVSSGSWQNNGAGAALKTLALKHADWVTWEHLNTTNKTGCYDSTNATYYVQQDWNDGITWLRVDDTDGNFETNTGTLTVQIYGVAEYNPYQSGCELQYTLGDRIETKTVQGNLFNGLPIDNNGSGIWDPIGGEFEVPIRYYMLETFGGPVDTGGMAFTWDVELGQSTLEGAIPSTYYDVDAASFVECYVQTDPVGHVRAFFAVDEQTDVYNFIRYYYGIRINDSGGTYSDNQGSIGYRLYEATNQQNPGHDTPSADGCLQFQHESTATSVNTLYAYNNPTGLSLGAFSSQTIYAIDITGGPWLEHGTSRYDVELSDDNGVSWTDLVDYGNLLCSQSADGNHLLVFLQGAAGHIWRIRVNDQDEIWTNNTGSLTVTLYGGNTQRDGYSKCDDNYTLTQVSLGDEVRRVPGNLGDGKAIPGIVKGITYALEITSESKWYEAGTGSGSYLVEISDDGGSTWTDLQDYTGLCTMQVGNGGLFKIYFTATSSTYKLRVNDGDTNFLTNTGQVYFNLFSAVDKTNPGSHSGPNKPPPEWVVACNQTYTRPSGIIAWYSLSFDLLGGTVSLSIPVPRIAEWIEYGKNAVVYFFAWCPEHTDALLNIGAVYENKEPFVSLVQLYHLYKNIQTFIEVNMAIGGEDADVNPSQEPPFFSDYDQMGSEGSASNYVAPPSGPLDMFIPITIDRSNNPLFGGKLDLTTVGQTDLNTPAMVAYKSYCNDQYYPMMGIAATGLCEITAVMRYTNITMWVLLVVDIICVLWYVFKYFPGWLHRLWDVITGNTPTIRKVARKI